MKRILVTGFEPFGASSVNVSQDAVLALEESLFCDDPWSSQRQLPDAKIHMFLEREILTVDEKGSLRTAQKIANGEQWDGILHIGVCRWLDETLHKHTAKPTRRLRRFGFVLASHVPGVHFAL